MGKVISIDAPRGLKCWDCGSNIPFHHTPLCDLAPKNAIRDLPQIPGTQWWNNKRPRKKRKRK